MATSKIKFTVTDGNIISVIAGADHVASLVFDVTTSPSDGTTISANGEVHQIYSLADAVELGIQPYGHASVYEGGVVHKHIADFFAINPNGELYVGLADCSADFTHISKVQTIAQGRIRQQGVYTRQDLFTQGTPYTVNHVAAINAIAEGDAVKNKPYSVILHANVATVGGVDADIDKIKATTLFGLGKRVSVNIGQENDQLTKDIQDGLTNKASVGTVGAFISLVSLANVHESIGWTAKFSLGAAVETIAFGWGGVVTDIDSNTPYEDLSDNELDQISENGFIFPHRYADIAGVYASKQHALSLQDYNTIAKNRAIDKSRRNVRVALLPTIQQPLYINPTTGKVSAGTIGAFSSIVHTQLSAMAAAGEISGFAIDIDASQNILTEDCFNISYRIVPVDSNDQLCIDIGLATQV